MKALVALGLVLLVSCATSTKSEKQAVEEKAAHTNVKDSKQLGGTIHDLIDSSKTLTETQKKELYKLIEVNKKTAEKLAEDSYRYRAVLIEELLSGKPSKKRVKIIKADIKRVEGLKLKNTFDTVEKISNIVSGHPDEKQYSEHLINIERSTR